MIRPIWGSPVVQSGEHLVGVWIQLVACLADQVAPRSFYWNDGPHPSATIAMSVDGATISSPGKQVR